jgi:hypothetical protein
VVAAVSVVCGACAWADMVHLMLEFLQPTDYVFLTALCVTVV